VQDEHLLTLPVLVLKDFALFPHCIAWFTLELMSQTQRQMLEHASNLETPIFIVKSRSGLVDASTPADLHRIGTVAKAGPKRTFSNSTRIQVSGASRGELVGLQASQEWPTAKVRRLLHIPAKDETGGEALRAAMSPWEEYETLCWDAGIHSGGIQMSPADVDAEDPAVLCDVLANGAQFRIENQKDVKFLDLQPLLDELDPLARFRLFREFFQGELDRLKNDPEISNKVEIERARRKREEELRAQERAEKIDRLAAIAAQPNPTAAVASLPAETLDLPLLPLRDIVMFPFVQSSFIVGRKRSIDAVEAAVDDLIFLATQRDSEIEEPASSDMFDIGVVVRIFQNVRLPDGNIKIRVQGLHKASVLEFIRGKGHHRAKLAATGLVENTKELTDALELAADLISTSGISIADRQKLLEIWDSNDPHGWIAKVIPFLREKSGS
jgi:ATP-dependent Lon protease